MVTRSGLRKWIARRETALRAATRKLGIEAHNEHTVMGPASPRRAPVRIVGRHEGVHVRQGKPRRPVLWRLAAESLDDPGHPRARVHGRAYRPRRVPLAAAADNPGCNDARDREPRVCWGARQVP
jgi:hypothetical protein